MNWFSNHFGKTWLAILALMAAGWVSNIIKLVCSGDLKFQAGMTLARVVGIFIFPVGSVLGYF
ncbi:hypothetical protein [Escherichia coli]|uniref:hypothetical protein n=1 Tax=Escherichia coli TaxID=562 RepID=UPI000BB4235A|nr:hypothetical protein [Escherichia coli]EIS3780968.1 hypothetical protein [Escherichia coli]PBK26298.1 hypothetical protein CMR91_26200 [Escherichia coli]HCQ3215038.1 hypothetical protein [Escherichia coli]